MGRCLVVGGDSTIGSFLSLQLRHAGKTVVTTTRRRDQTHSDQIYFDLASLAPINFDTYDQAFLCAGITNISECEKDPHRTYQINVDATVNVARQLLSRGCRVMFISSNTVFDGKVKSPHENSAYQYSTEYGRQKSEAEQQLLALGTGITVIRITKVTSFSSPLFLSILKNLKANQPTDLFMDLLISPISLNYLSNSMIKIADSRLDGVFHLSGSEDVSYAKFGTLLAQYIGADPKLVRPVETEATLFKPQYASLGMQRTTQMLNILPESNASLFSNLIGVKQ